MAETQQYRVGTDWRVLEVLSEPFVKITARGYVPAVRVRVVGKTLEYHLFIAPRSLAVPLEDMRVSNDGKFKGLCFRVRKESEEKMARYEVEAER